MRELLDDSENLYYRLKTYSNERIKKEIAMMQDVR